jgi:hypothetical protein
MPSERTTRYTLVETDFLRMKGGFFFILINKLVCGYDTIKGSCDTRL